MAITKKDIIVQNPDEDTFRVPPLKKQNPYFAAFVKAFDLQQGDPVKAPAYMAWIGDKHRDFRKRSGLRSYQPYTDEQKKEFNIFICLGQENPQPTNEGRGTIRKVKHE